MVEHARRRLDVLQTQCIETLFNHYEKAQNEPNEPLLKSLNEQVNAEVYRSLLNHMLELEDEINALKEKMILVHERHLLLKTRFLALQMLQRNVESHPWFTDEKVAWLTIQLRDAQRDFTKSKLSEIHLIDIRIKGLYTQLDHTRYLLQSGKPS
jgi:hypothetical protein